MKEDPPEIVKWEKKRSVRKSRPLHSASPKHLCVQLDSSPFLFPSSSFFPSTWPTIPSRQFLLFSPGSQSCPARWTCPAGGSLFFLAGGDGDQLFGGFGDVVGALDDLLGEELVVHRTDRRVGGRRFTTLHLQAGRTGPQELQGRTYCI